MIGSGYRPDKTANEEQEHLLPLHVEMTDMETQSQDEETSCGEPLGQIEQAQAAVPAEEQQIEYKVYKRRWFGLVQLVLLNIVVSWDVSIAVPWKRTILSL